MNLPRFFADRPVFAAVLSIVIVLLGGLAYFQLPVSQYPEVVPPTVIVSASYPGANAQTVSETLAAPLEQEINGVEGMLYMSSSGTSDGRLNLTVTFKLGTNLDDAQVQVQNRVNAALPRLPEDVRRLGVTAKKQSPDLTLAVQFFSPDGSREIFYLANYVTLQVQSRIARLPGVADANTLGGQDFTMRIWLDPEKLAARELTSGDVVRAIREQNVQVAAGAIGQEPASPGTDFQFTLTAQGRLSTAEQFGEIVLRTGTNGDVIRVRDVARVELGARDYAVKSYMDGKNAISLRIFQLPGTNALTTADAVYAEMAKLKERFPPGVDYRINYDPTRFVRQSFESVLHTLLEAIALVVLVVILFLQTWRASIIPLLAVPVSLIGTFAVMKLLGSSLNNLSLFGLVLAIGIVVDDAIVVVENVERYLQQGLSRRDATLKAMGEVSGALVAIALVLCAVFVPTAFLGGITGQFYRQFALTIATATVISAINSLTLSPALTALLLKKHAPPTHRESFPARLLHGFFAKFNAGFESLADRYARVVRWLVKHSKLALAGYAGLIALTVFTFSRVPVGFIPVQDMGYFLVVVQLPDGASFARSDVVVRQVDEIARATEGVAHTFAISGYSSVLQANQSNVGAAFIIPADFKDRKDKSLTAAALMNTLRQKFSSIKEARILVLPPPPLRGLGNSGGFRIQVQDLDGAGLASLEAATRKLMDALAKEPGFTSLITGFRPNTPQYFVDINRAAAKNLGVSLGELNETLQISLGSVYVNDFNLFGRTYQVFAMAEPQFRDSPEDVSRLQMRNRDGEMVPLGSLVQVNRIGGADRVQRYNMFTSADVTGNTLAGVSSGQMIETVQRLGEQELPRGFSFEWTDLAFQQILAGNTIVYVFPLCVLFVFLVLAAQYESWGLPLAVILIVPMCLLSALAGVWGAGQDNNIFTQVGLVVLVGLASKNAILIVEFAKQLQDSGKSVVESAVEAARLRLRPILMTSLAFILGVLPLALATGAGSEMRRALGTTVFWGMLGVTIFGLLLTPVFYVVIRSRSERRSSAELGKEITPDAEPRKREARTLSGVAPILLGAVAWLFLGGSVQAANFREVPALAELLKAKGVTGTFVLLDPDTDTVFGTNEVRAKERFTPASTFKIANALLGLEHEVVTSVEEILPYGGKPQPFKQWERDMSLREAMKLSSVPIYQELARRIGLERIREGIAKLAYGNREIGSVVDRFWLDGPLAISALEQTEFLSRVAAGKLPIRATAIAAVKEITLLEQTDNLRLHGKTGWVFGRQPQIGWFVGWIERGGKMFPFALNMDIAREEDLPKRVSLARECLQILGKL